MWGCVFFKKNYIMYFQILLSSGIICRKRSIVIRVSSNSFWCPIVWVHYNLFMAIDSVSRFLFTAHNAAINILVQYMSMYYLLHFYEIYFQEWDSWVKEYMRFFYFNRHCSVVFHKPATWEYLFCTASLPTIGVINFLF